MRLIEAQGLVAGPAGIPAVRGLDLYVDEGEIVALLGPNGAGKSVTLATIAGVLPILGGEIDVLGLPVRGASIQAIARRGLAFLASDRGLFTQLTASENLRLYRNKRSTVLLEDVLGYLPAIEEHLQTKVGLLSGGEQQMLALGCQLIADPKVMLIDELSHGLAPILVERILAALRRIVAGTGIGIMLVEQSLSHALAVADRAYLLSSGQLMFAGTAAEARAAGDVIEASYLGTLSEQPGPFA